MSNEPADPAPTGQAASPKHAGLIEQGDNAISEGRFADARDIFARALQQQSAGGPSTEAGDENTYLLQRLALSTYKAKEPDEVAALDEAMELLLNRLNLNETNDAATVSLAGEIEKRLFDTNQGADHLSLAIRYYWRSYCLSSERDKGMTLAYLMNVRTDSILDLRDSEKIADLVWANRVRREVVEICEEELEDLDSETGREDSASGELPQERAERLRIERFWCLAAKAEAHVGLGEMRKYESTFAQMAQLNPDEFMRHAFEERINGLKELLESHGHLLDPPWRGR